MEHDERTVYRCDIDGCKKVFLLEDVKKGGCPHCGGRRFKFAGPIEDREVVYLESRGFDTSVLGESPDAY